MSFENHTHSNSKKIISNSAIETENSFKMETPKLDTQNSQTFTYLNYYQNNTSLDFMPIDIREGAQNLSVPFTKPLSMYEQTFHSLGFYTSDHFKKDFENYLLIPKNGEKERTTLEFRHSGYDDNEEVKNEFKFEEEDEKLYAIINRDNRDSQTSNNEGTNDKRSIVGRDSNDHPKGKERQRQMQLKLLEHFKSFESPINNFTPSIEPCSNDNQMIMEESSSNYRSENSGYDPGRLSFMPNRNQRSLQNNGRMNNSDYQNSTKSEKQEISGCKCKNSKCLQLYCECFKSRSYCGPACSCIDCHSKPEFDELLYEFYEEMEIKCSGAFKPKIKQIETGEVQVHSRGCNCKKSGCLKGYCECHANGILCTPLCKCKECRNFGDKLPQNELEQVKEIVHRKRKRKDKTFDKIYEEKMKKYPQFLERNG